MSARSELSEAGFVRDIATHEMIVLRDDGVYRHLRFKRPGTGCMHFDLVTWPGYLAYSGDMGCYVFSRLTDMFEFFRTDRRESRGNDLCINPGYWSEKLQAVDGNRREAGAMEFDPERFREIINEYRVEWMRERRLDKEARRELWDAISDEVLSHVDDGEHAAWAAASDFTWRASALHGGPQYQFGDLWERNAQRYTYRFLWCCYALAWAIRTYDTATAPALEAA